MNTNMQAGRTNFGRYPYSVVEGGLKQAIEHEHPRQNKLLASLSEPVLSRLLPHLERVQMSVGDVIYQFGSQSQHVWFPADSIVSLIYDMEDGASAEVAIVIRSRCGATASNCCSTPRSASGRVPLRYRTRIVKSPGIKVVACLVPAFTNRSPHPSGVSRQEMRAA